MGNIPNKSEDIKTSSVTISRAILPKQNEENRPLEQEINERLSKSFYKGAGFKDLVDRKQYVYDLPSEMINYSDEIN